MTQTRETAPVTPNPLEDRDHSPQSEIEAIFQQVGITLIPNPSEDHPNQYKATLSGFSPEEFYFLLSPYKKSTKPPQWVFAAYFYRHGQLSGHNGDYNMGELVGNIIQNAACLQFKTEPSNLPTWEKEYDDFIEQLRSQLAVLKKTL